MEWMPDAVEAALIAGGVSLCGLLISNQSKVSEFRQTWINALREDIALLISQAFEIHAAGSVEEVSSSFSKVQEATARIRLRLNPAEVESKAIISAMAQLRERIHSESTFEHVNTAVNELTEATQVVLKKEWRRVKSGEPFYCWTRRVLLIGLGLLVLITLYTKGCGVWTWVVSR
jgi:hypothetical protein